MAKITLKAARVNAGYTQKEAAELIGVSNRTLGRWENMISFPNVEQINKICELYNVSYADLSFTPESA